MLNTQEIRTTRKGIRNLRQRVEKMVNCGDISMELGREKVEQLNAILQFLSSRAVTRH